jgi:hypothetical protein
MAGAEVYYCWGGRIESNRARHYYCCACRGPNRGGPLLYYSGGHAGGQGPTGQRVLNSMAYYSAGPLQIVVGQLPWGRGYNSSFPVGEGSGSGGSMPTRPYYSIIIILSLSASRAEECDPQ